MNQQIATLKQYIRLKYSGNASEFAREYGMSEKNMSRTLKSGRHYVDMTNGALYVKSPKQRNGQ